MKFRPEDRELRNGRVVEQTAGVRFECRRVEFAIGVVDGFHLLLGDGCEGVCEHAGQGRDVLEFGREACADDVVGGGHAFHDI